MASLMFYSKGYYIGLISKRLALFLNFQVSTKKAELWLWHTPPHGFVPWILGKQLWIMCSLVAYKKFHGCVQLKVNHLRFFSSSTSLFFKFNQGKLLMFESYSPVNFKCFSLTSQVLLRIYSLPLFRSSLVFDLNKRSFPSTLFRTTSLKLTLTLAENTLILRIPKHTFSLAACWHAGLPMHSIQIWIEWIQRNAVLCDYHLSSVHF